ncbi:hypothetical protein N9X24_01630 [Rickettsiales bacterium]|nr:hypothetical protein [Rickettsiales bacterium]
MAKFPIEYIMKVSDEELEKINQCKIKNDWSLAATIRNNLLIGGIMENDDNLLKNITILQRSKKIIYNNQVKFKYSTEMEKRIKYFQEKTGAYKTSIIRNFLKNAKLI